jgi:hypothetical protein
MSDPLDSHPENPLGSQIRWPKAGRSGKVGIYNSTPEPHPQARENQPESSDVNEDESKPAPENQVLLKNPMWNCDTGVPNDPVSVQVEADLPPEQSHLTRIVFTLFAQLKSGRREQKILHVQFNRRTVDGVMIMPGKVHPVFSFKDKIATKDGWTVDCLKSETTPDYQQRTGVGSKNGSVVKATMYDAPSLTQSLFTFYDPKPTPPG